ncbi:MAG: hypothetical protein AB1502_09915 [Thermodesulfobacteriota bacterium]
MKKILRHLLTRIILLLILLYAFNIPWIVEVRAENKLSVAVLPFFIEKEAVCPICKGVYQRGEILPGAQNTLTRLLQQKMETLGKFRVLPLEKTEEAFFHWERRRFEERIIPSSIQLGEELNVDFLFVGFLFRFEERIGSSIGVEKPASVGFDIHLFRIRDGVEVWRGKFDETQSPLSENLLKIGSFFRRKASWLTAGELSSVGMDEMLRRLPGSQELEEKQ